MTHQRNQRILVVDDNPSIHDDFKKVLQSSGGASRALADMESALFGDAPANAAGAEGTPQYEITCARQGMDALELVRAAVKSGQPYAVAFLDVRMPPGWDGVETLERLWQVDPELQAVICTAFSDYTWGETVARLGRSDRLLVLKKPFDAIEVCQMASALIEKWNLTQSERHHLEGARAAECEARAYAASLETVNHALETALATAEESSRARADFLLHVTRELLRPMAGLLERAGELRPGQRDDAQSARAAAAIQREGHALQRMLRDIVDLSELEAGGLELEKRACEPHAMARQCLDQARPSAAERGVVLKLECASPVPARIDSDCERLGRILDVLVANAIQRSPRGEEVKLRLAFDASAGWQEPQLHLSVIDRGEPIPPERLGRLFEPFQADAGASIGLCLSKRVAHLLGGDVSVQSELEPGTSFVVSVRTGALDGVAMLE
jgi:two-component system sensor histidine kinase/response regulator